MTVLGETEILSLTLRGIQERELHPGGLKCESLKCCLRCNNDRVVDEKKRENDTMDTISF